MNLPLLILVVNGFFIFRFSLDFIRHIELVKKENGNPVLLAFSSMIIFFLSSFGICDFAISTIFYRFKKLVSDKKLPGTLNTQCVIPVAVMACAFISSIQVGLKTLIVCIIAQVVGAYIGPQFVVKLSISMIRKIISLGLFLAAVFIVLGQLHWLPAGGVATELHGVKLLIAAGALFIFGALNNVGIGSYPLTMATIYMLGMSPLASFPIMMGACAFSTSIASVQFIKHGQYSRKITLFTSTFGVLGVLIAVYVIKELNVAWLQWIITAIIFYTSFSMLYKEYKAPIAQLTVNSSPSNG
ncbi:integral membrane protein [Legionella santicrucis]|uniref:Integral membrane protein n=1 Tax=Legionella santicrucis TaxID=45074 RepID=A0A0W0Y8N9_9GAMM|nr:sulfite exporter TauE/SafE family protein [Legionella santicrucis]KTD53253.1 integral membrane protein [Legionella santicrucis]